MWVQAQERRPERGFVIDRSWRHATYGSGRPWPADTVKLFFDTSISGSDTTWMLTNLRRAQSATGIRFPHYAASGSRRYQWTRCSSPYLKIMRAELGDWAGSATIGKVGCSFLKMDHGTARNESGEDAFYHEVGHVLGLIHEHQRYDRDEYVSVQRRGTNYDRIFRWRNQRFWFLFWSWLSAVRNSTTYDTPYDYHSVMHYRAGITLRDGGGPWTVRARNKSVWGSRNHSTYFTPWDLYTIKLRYGITPNRRPTYTPRPAYPSS